MLGFALLGLLGIGLIVGLGSDDDNADDSQDNPGNDIFIGTNSAEFADAGAGDDSVTAGGGNDLVDAGPGDDLVFGENGDDLLVGAGGDDVLDGGNGADLIFGGAGEDELIGAAGNDLLSGADIIDAEGFIDIARAAALEGRAPTEAELDSLVDLDGDPGEADLLNGGDGDDSLLAGSNDIVFTGEGADVVNVGTWVQPGDPVSIGDFDPALDAIVYTYEGLPPNQIGFGTTADGVAALIVEQQVIATFDGVSADDLTASTQIVLEPFDFDAGAGDTFTGSLGADSFTGTGGDDFFDTGEGNDVIEARAGDDTVAAGGGDDIVQGQGGDDVINGQTGDDFVQGRGDNDTIRGEAGNDWVDGGDGNDSVSGQEGADTVIGGAGEDTLAGGNNDDLLIGGTVLGAPFSTADLTGLRDGTVTYADLIGAIPGLPIPLDDDNAVDILNGRNDDDTLIFGAGDVVTGGTGADDFVILANSVGNTAGVSTITDFNADEDTVVVSLDIRVGRATLVEVFDDGDDALILIDGIATTRVLGGAGIVTEGTVRVVSGIDVDLLNPA